MTMKIVSRINAVDGWKKFAAIAVVGAGATAVAQPAQAQDTGLVPVRVKVGMTYSQSSATRTFSGSTGLTGEVDVRVPWLGASNVMFSAGYQESSRNGRKLRVIPITLSKTFGPPNPLSGATGNVYFGAGVGAYLVKASGGGVSNDGTKVGGFGMVGYQFPNPYFIEAKYHLVGGKVGGVRANNLALMVGRHF